MITIMHDDAELEGFDFRGKTIAISSHVNIKSLDRVSSLLKKYAVHLPDGMFKVQGFLLGTVVNYSVHGQVWVQFPFSNEPVEIAQAHVIRFILDDEALPELIGNLPLLVSNV